MPAVCCYFQVHQPTFLKKISYLDKITDSDFFDEEKIKQNIQKISATSYLPACQTLLSLLKKHDGKFRLALSFSGTVLEQFAKYAPDVLVAFKELVMTGFVEILSESYYRSFSVLYDEREYIYQLRRHRKVIEEYFGVEPAVLCNSELLYSDRLGQLAFRLGYKGILTGIGKNQLGWRSANFLYQGRANDLAIFVKNYQLSDDIAFRFSKHDWSEFPLTADKFASWIHQANLGGNSGEIVNLFMDFETFGEHHWKTSGIFDFLRCFPDEVLKGKNWSFVTPSDAVSQMKPISELVCPSITSWGAVGNDLAAWMGGSLQGNALNLLYGLTEKVRQVRDEVLLESWRKLQISDNFYYMLAGSYDIDSGDRESPYKNQSDAYINYMNVLRKLEEQIDERLNEKTMIKRRLLNNSSVIDQSSMREKAPKRYSLK